MTKSASDMTNILVMSGPYYLTYTVFAFQQERCYKLCVWVCMSRGKELEWFKESSKQQLSYPVNILEYMWRLRGVQNSHLSTAEKVNSSCEHVFNPRPETHRWHSNQQIAHSASASLSKVRIWYCWSGQCYVPTVKDKYSDKQENVITQSHCAAHCCGKASESSI